MNYKYLLFILLLSCNQGPLDESQIEIYRIVETMPVLAICNSEPRELKTVCTGDILKSFITDNMQYPELAKKNHYEDTVAIQFIVERDGSMMDIKLIRDKKFALGKEGLRLVNLMRDELEWVSGKQREKAVRVRFTLPIVFKL